MINIDEIKLGIVQPLKKTEEFFRFGKDIYRQIYKMMVEDGE